MAVLQNDVLLRALLRQPTPYTPIWLMRQAGRYLPEYKATRARAGSFMGLATNPGYATEVTLQPLTRYRLDAAILFSDILTIPDAMGLELSFTDGEGPRFAKPLQNEDAIMRLQMPNLEKLSYVFDAVAEICRALTQEGKQRLPLIGFSGSPWTLACYMVEGKGSTDFRTIKTMLYSRPDLLHHILQINADAAAAYLNAQIDAGVQTVMIFDTWGGILADGIYQQFSLAYTQRVLAQLQREKNGVRIPTIVFTKGGGGWLEEIAAINNGCQADAVGLDWTVNLSQARARIGHTCALQGNLDPAVLFSPPSTIRAQARQVINAYVAGSPIKQADGHIFNLGHGISQFTPPEHVSELIDEVHTYSHKIRQIAV